MTLPTHLHIDEEHLGVTWRGQPVILSYGEFKAVLALTRASGKTLTYRKLYDAVRGEGFQAGSGDEGYRGNVRAMVKRIRSRFKLVDSSFEAIRCYASVGYSWRVDSPAASPVGYHAAVEALTQISEIARDHDGSDMSRLSTINNIATEALAALTGPALRRAA